MLLVSLSVFFQNIKPESSDDSLVNQKTEMYDPLLW